MRSILMKDGNIVFDWGGENAGKKYPFNRLRYNPRDPLENSGLLQRRFKRQNVNFEIDSNAKQRCYPIFPSGSGNTRQKLELTACYIQEPGLIIKILLLPTRDNYYLFWTSVDTNTVEAGNKQFLLLSVQQAANIIFLKQ